MDITIPIGSMNLFIRLARCALNKLFISSPPVTGCVLAASLGIAASSFGMVNNVPGTPGTADANAHLEQQWSGLDRVIAAEFSGIVKFPYWEHIGMVGMGSG